ncbi:hypothetical protein RND81_07G087500 [Saponaria officinalis]|uniref:Secreted protein n=1 Tax=Saponaria officinalis TaxID=3572 RepID=A0AAW1JPS1_SAPOF
MMMFRVCSFTILANLIYVYRLQLSRLDFTRLQGEVGDVVEERLPEKHNESRVSSSTLTQILCVKGKRLKYVSQCSPPPELSVCFLFMFYCSSVIYSGVLSSAVVLSFVYTCDFGVCTMGFIRKYVTLRVSHIVCTIA